MTAHESYRSTEWVHFFPRLWISFRKTIVFIYFNFTEEKVPDRPAKPGTKPVPPVPARVDEAPPTPTEVKTNPINYANVYQALWDCATNETDELGFRRGDLIYIYEKPHADWWIGSLFKPQGFNVGLVPKDYVMEAYEITAS